MEEGGNKLDPRDIFFFFEGFTNVCLFIDGQFEIMQILRFPMQFHDFVLVAHLDSRKFSQNVRGPTPFVP